ncbi:hypothetical protein BpHYR1_022655 [Brachionus plicatilis]|uniref:Uncharacterized protein n=1 Tax=Brachionus plicatilis TaxID=10195 RepID=A0A3M7P3E5_BRAPC|nr:hypothetical protein BpHYR1_022655 [Brachionus plicatilis]
MYFYTMNSIIQTIILYFPDVIWAYCILITVPISKRNYSDGNKLADGRSCLKCELYVHQISVHKFCDQTIKFFSLIKKIVANFNKHNIKK